MVEYVQTYKKLTKENVVSRLENAITEIVDYIMKLYDDQLISPVTDASSRANPLHYREEFLERLNDFEYIEDFGDVINFIVPSMNNFDFSGRLKIIENIMDGTVGTFIEVDGKQYEALFPTKKPPTVEALDRSVPKSRMIYLVKYTYGLGKMWRTIFPKEKMVRFPFSNSPPIRIFEDVNAFVDGNLDKWVDEAVDNTTKKFEKLIK
jgi:hypothetical protein